MTDHPPIDNDTTVTLTPDNKVKHVNQQTQMFDAEDYVDIYNDTIQNYENIQNTLDKIEEDMEELLDNDAMEVLHTVLEDHEQEGVLEADAVTEEDLSDYQDLQQKKQQREQMKQKEDSLKRQLLEMREVVEQIDTEAKVEDLPFEEVGLSEN